MRTIVGWMLGACLLVGAAAAQETRFRSGVDLVGLNVVVADGRGQLLPGLSREDFTVFEDGAKQDITFFADVPVPVDLAVLLDTSSSMLDKMTTVQHAAIGFTSVVRPDDRIAIVEIKEAVKIVHPLDGDVEGARRAISATTARGNTSLYNGLYLTLRELAKHRGTDDDIRRQAIVVLSDGDDTSSLVGFDDVMPLARQTGVAIYTITLRPSGFARTVFPRDVAEHSASEFAMKALALETGAQAFFPAAVSELSGVYTTIASELSSQYSVGYLSTNPRLDGSYRRISVRVDREGTRVRTRAGYVAAPPTSVANR